jgi:hypothetical protein
VRAIAVLAPLLAACSSSASGTLQLVTGGESDTFTRSPAPSTLRVDAIDSSGQVTTLATAHLPTATIDLGTQDENAVATLEISGLDDSGTRLVYGASIPLQYGALDGVTVPIFVQRTGELARMPGPLPDSRQAPALSSVQGQYLFVGGGNDPALAQQTQFYDFGQLAPFSSPPTLPRRPQSIAFVGTIALIVDDNGGTYFDFSANAAYTLQTPAGGSFADIAGGDTVVANDGTEYIVGATRTTGPATASVLIINPNDASTSATQPTGKLTWASLSAPRFGASATWVTGRGLVVAGGSTSAPGVEVLAALPNTKGAPLAYPPDASMGAGATTLDTQHVLLAGGLGVGGQDAGARSIDLACTAACTPAVWSALPVPIGTAQAFSLDAANAVVVGSEAGPSNRGLTHVFRLTSTAAKELPTKVPHYNARALLSPLGTMLVVGGASEIESFAP